MINNNLLFILYVLSIIITGIGIGYFIKGLTFELKFLRDEIEDLKERLIRLENKIMKL